MADGALTIRILSWIPKNLLSRATGRLVRLPLPWRWLRRWVIGWFAGRFGADVTEADRPLDEYGSVGEFFIRRLKPGVRPLDTSPDVVVSPADGRVLLAGAIVEGRALQIKGKPYEVAELIPGEDAAIERLAGGTFATVYLSPKDYHRVHSPVTGDITGYQLVPGALWPVNSAGVTHVDRLFCRNERLTTFIETERHGLVVVCMVGATNVGRMTLAYETDVLTNTRNRSVRRRRYDDAIPIAMGDELGIFHMGSTVVLLVERGGLVAPVDNDGPIRMGQALLGPVTPT